MANRLPLPDDLQHLVEKRDEPTRHTGEERRKRQTDGAIPDANDAAAENEPKTPTRSDTDRRSGDDRRRGDRRTPNQSD